VYTTWIHSNQGTAESMLKTLALICLYQIWSHNSRCSTSGVWCNTPH